MVKRPVNNNPAKSSIFLKNSKLLKNVPFHERWNFGVFFKMLSFRDKTGFWLKSNFKLHLTGSESSKLIKLSMSVCISNEIMKFAKLFGQPPLCFSRTGIANNWIILSLARWDDAWLCYLFSFFSCRQLLIVYTRTCKSKQCLQRALQGTMVQHAIASSHLL